MIVTWVMSTYRLVEVAFLLSVCFAQNYALRFFGNGENDIDRVKVLIGTTGNPLNIGDNFTIEFRLKATLSDNPQGASVQEGAHGDWIYGHTIVDRDIFGDGDYGDFGISLAGGRIAFGVNNGTNSYTIVSNTSVADGVWHAIAVTRDTTGALAIFIDGQLDKAAQTPVTGDISYRVGRPTSWANDPYLVIGAEKHDYDRTQYPSFSGAIDEMRISTMVRYTANYTPSLYLSDDAHTVALYHFDEGSGTTLGNSASLSGIQGNGTIHYGGNPSGPIWELVGTTGCSAASATGGQILSPSGTVKALFHPSEKNLPVFDSMGRYYGTVEQLGERALNVGLYFIGPHKVLRGADGGD